MSELWRGDSQQSGHGDGRGRAPVVLTSRAGQPHNGRPVAAETHQTTRSKDVGASGHCGDQVTPPQPGKSLENCRSKFTVTRWHQSAIKTPKDKPQTKNPKPAQKGWVRTLKAFPLWPAHHAQAPANWLVPSSFRAGLLPQFASSHCQSPLEPPSQTRPHRHAHRMASHSCPLVTPRLQPIGW